MPSHASVYDSLETFRREYRFTYVDVGARWGAKSALLALFPNSRWVGFEPDRDECAAINAKREPRQECLPYALSDVAGSRRLHITKSPDWSSLYEPDPEVFGQFNGLVDFYPVMRQVEVPTGSLDELAVDHGELLGNADYLKLDAQGAGPDVLRGAKNLLATSFVAAEIEVEFLAVYKGQPLFDEVHRTMIDNGFLLLDLSRNRCIRADFPVDVETRGQLIWSDVTYLKDYRPLIANRRGEKLFALVLVAMELGFPDYSLAVARATVASGIGGDGVRRDVDRALEALREKQRRRTRLVDVVVKLPGGRKLLRALRKAIDGNYERIVTLAYPEYYFRRD